jgi:hypothetical protein
LQRCETGPLQLRKIIVARLDGCSSEIELGVNLWRQGALLVGEIAIARTHCQTIRLAHGLDADDLDGHAQIRDGAADDH